MRNLDPGRRRWARVRIAVLGALLLAGGVAVAHRAYVLQVQRAPTLRQIAEGQYLREIRLSPLRGTIYDRHGAELAVSVEVDSAYANPRMLREAGQDPVRVTRLLAQVLPIDEETILARLSSDRLFVWVQRRITPEQAARIRDLGIPGVELTQETRRFYPNRELASHLLGFANVDGVGIEGLELSLEESLRGSVRRVPAIRDARGRIVFSEQLLDDRGSTGDDVHLTIDKTIQHVAERELALAVSTFEAHAGSVVVMDPTTGELLAVANYPTFNPNDPGATPASHRRNRAVTDRFEPGSTVKPFTVAAALDRGSVRSEELIDCMNGEMQVGEDDVIHDSHAYDRLTPAQILAFSSNIGTAQIARTLGRQGLYRAFRQFGFGERTGLPLPGETAGLLRHYRQWYEMDAATISFGQGMSTTTVQLATAMSVVANGGRLMQPLLVSRVASGDDVVEHHPEVRRRVMRPDTARLVADMLTAVTGPGGTGREAAIDGYLVAGKTGTAQKANDMGTGYADDRWLASFVGFVPAQAPRLVIAVVIDEPMIAHYGGDVAGPVFRRVGEAALRHLGVPAHGGGQALVEHEDRERRVAREARRAARELREAIRAGTAPAPAEPPAPSEGDALAVVTTAGPGEVSVPDLRGMSAREVVLALTQATLEPALDGSGVVVGQEPPPSSVVPAGTRVRARLRRPVVRVVPPPPPAEEERATGDTAPAAPARRASGPLAQNLVTRGARR